MTHWSADYGWRGKIGVIATPAVDNAHIELMRVAPEGVGVYQTFPYVPGFRVEAERIVKAVEQLEHCGMALGSAGVDVIGQVGTPFSFAQGHDLEWAHQIRSKLEVASGKPVALMGLSIIEALRDRGYRTVAVSSTYYNQDLCTRYARFLEAGGIRVLVMKNWVDQGRFAEESLMNPPKLWYPASYAYQSAREVAAEAPDADCIIMSGAAVHTMDIIKPLENDLQKPVISSDSAFFWNLLCLLGVRDTTGGWGSLLDSLSGH
jgi:maleate cis-trans isomerase